MKRDRSDQFGGVAKDFAPASLPPGLYQEDVGGERFLRGSWRRRRGILRTDVPKQDGPVTSLVGVEVPGGDFALLLVAGSEVHGFANVQDQDFTTSAGSGEGWGETEFGEDFGE